MSKQLIVTEKPSVGVAIAKVLNVKDRHDGYLESEEYIITWAVGHLITLAEPKEQDLIWEKWELETLPILPKEYKTVVIPTMKKQFEIIKKLIHRNDVTHIINGGDAGREGEYIQRLIYEKAGNTKPLYRLWIDSNAEKTIREGFSNLQPGGKYDGLYESAKGRARGDMVIGDSFSRLISLLYNVRGLSIGRVQTPTLAMVVKRDHDIKNFVSETYYELVATFEEGFSAVWFNEKGSKIKEESVAESLIKKIMMRQGTICSIEKEEKSINRPRLYNLAKIQADGNRLFGYEPKKTLQIVQSLYERHKIVTYPRTDSEYITEDISEEIKGLIQMISRKENYQKTTSCILSEGMVLDSNIVNNAKVTDHHAIIINENYGQFDLSSCSEEEKNILHLIVIRMLLAVSKKYIYEETKIICEVEKETFSTSGKVPIQMGWKKYEKIFFEKNEKEKDDFIIPPVIQGQEITCNRAGVKEKKTKPPKPFTLGDLILAMEKISNVIDEKELKDALKGAGIGTSATRADIIDKLLKKGYIEYRGKSKAVQATNNGRFIIEVAPSELTTPHLTAEWELYLTEIANGNKTLEGFMSNIAIYAKEVTNRYIKSKPIPTIHYEDTSQEVIGKCPWCGGNVLENTKSGMYSCQNYRVTGCSFALWKNDKYFESLGVSLIKNIAISLLNQRKVSLKKLKSKKGTTYDATIHVDFSMPTEDVPKPRPTYKMEFAEKKKPSRFSR